MSNPIIHRGAADERREAKVLKSPNAEMMGEGEGILIIDDLVDTGQNIGVGARFIQRRILPAYTQNPKVKNKPTPISHRYHKTPGYFSRGTWRYNTSNPIAARIDP